jgi:predicted DNA-binding transcriptional regulator AlpA
MPRTATLLTIQEVADRLGVTPSTISAYKSRKQMPPPDRQYGRTPLWKATTIDTWRPEVRSAE